MGTNSSKTQKQELIISHQKFPNVRQLTFDQIEAIISIPNQEEYNKWKSQLKKINSFNKQNILSPLNHSFTPQGICGSTSGIVKIVFDNFPYIFQEQLQNRAKIQKHLDQQEMWYLLFTLVSTAHDFSSINKKIGDIRPHNIFVNETGQIKLGNSLSWPNTPTNCQKTFYDKQKTYISLQEMQMCNKGKIDSIINNSVAQSFSIGLTMLHAGLLFDFSQIYNVDKFQMDIAVLLKKLNQWQELQFFDQERNKKVNYSSALKGIVKNLCEIHSSKRQSSLEIYKLLQPYKTQILNLQQFQLSKQHSKSLSEASSQFNTIKQKYKPHNNQFHTPAQNHSALQIPINYNSTGYNNNHSNKISYPNSYSNGQPNINNLGYQLGNNSSKNVSNQTFGKKNQNSYDYFLKQQPINNNINSANHYHLFKNYADNSINNIKGNNKTDFIPSATSAVSNPGIGAGLLHSHSTYTIEKTEFQPQKIVIKQIASYSGSNYDLPTTSYKKYESYSNLNLNANNNNTYNNSPRPYESHSGNNIIREQIQRGNKYSTFTQVSKFQIGNQGISVSLNSNKGSKMVEYDSNDFLRKIDQQLMKSKSLFPS